MLEVCFVCTGDTCRSVMAERIARKMARDMGLKCRFSSAGLEARKENISENARLTLKKLGYDYSNRTSVQLKERPNVVYVCVTGSHKQFVESARVISFKSLAGEVIDPYGKDLETYEKCAHLIEENVKVLLEKIKRLGG